jgi:DedD protein
MEQARLKYRIVGGIVLLALAAILVPLLNEVRQPLPAGPQAIDIPAEPADGVTAALPVDGELPEGSVPEPQDLPKPVPAPPLTEEGDEPAPVAGEPVTPERAPRDAVAAPIAKPDPVKPVPVPVIAAKPAAVQSAPVAKPPAPQPAAAPTQVAAKPAPAPKPPLAAPVPAKPAAVASATPASAPAPKVAAMPTAKPPTSTAGAPGAQQAWVVQLGVYGNLKTAIDLRERLRKAGHSAFTEEVATPHGKALRVRVGPDLDRAAAQALRDRLARETGHDGIVMAYP